MHYHHPVQIFRCVSKKIKKATSTPSAPLTLYLIKAFTTLPFTDFLQGSENHFLFPKITGSCAACPLVNCAFVLQAENISVLNVVFLLALPGLKTAWIFAFLEQQVKCTHFLFVAKLREVCLIALGTIRLRKIFVDSRLSNLFVTLLTQKRSFRKNNCRKWY